MAQIVGCSRFARACDLSLIGVDVRVLAVLLVLLERCQPSRSFRPCHRYGVSSHLLEKGITELLLARLLRKLLILWQQGCYHAICHVLVVVRQREIATCRSFLARVIVLALVDVARGDVDQVGWVVVVVVATRLP